MKYWSLVLAKAVPTDVPPPVFLVIGVGLVIWGFKCLYDWRSSAAKRPSSPEPSEHLSLAQKWARDASTIKLRQYKVGTVTFLLMGTFFIGLYLVISRA